MNTLRSVPAQAAKQLACRMARRVLNLRHWIFAGYLRVFVRSPVIGPPPPAPGTGARILIVRLDEIGDFILTVPCLRAIRKHYRSAHITLLVNSSVQAIARACPYIDELIVFPMKSRALPFDQVGTYLAARQFAKRCLKGKGFDCALIARADIDNGGALAMAYHAGIPWRIGFAEAAYPLKALKNQAYDRFLTHVVERSPALHEVNRILDLARTLGADARDTRLELWPSEEDEACADTLLAQFQQPGRLLVALAPGAGIERRRWPIDRFAELAVLLAQAMSAQVVIVGGPSDEALGRAIVAEVGDTAAQVLDLAGRTSLGATAAVLRRCSLFVGNDSGPMHMAAAMHTPCVELSCHPTGGSAVAANSPLRFSPWEVSCRVLQPAAAVAPCDTECTRSDAHCIKAISVHEAFAAAQDLLTSSHRVRACG